MILYDGGRALVIDKKNVSDHCVAQKENINYSMYLTAKEGFKHIKDSVCSGNNINFKVILEFENLFF